jgi:hypothetical protein
MWTFLIELITPSVDNQFFLIQTLISLEYQWIISTSKLNILYEISELVKIS